MAIVRRVEPSGSVPTKVGERRPLVEMWLQGRSPRTLAAYQDDLRNFATFLGASEGPKAADYLVSLSHAEANEVVLRYRNAQIESGLAPATINRRLAALRSLVKLANLLGHVHWLLGVENIKHEKYRDTAGPGEMKIEKMLAYCEGRRPAIKAERDIAILRLMFDMGLRRGEVAELGVEHLNLAERRLSVLGKGRTERVTYTIPTIVAAALSAWIDVRPLTPLLFGIETGHGIWNIVKKIGEKAGVGKVWPHGLRHSGITRALDVTGGDVRAVQKFSRHKNVNTLMIYDDNRRDMFGDVAERASQRGKK